jgi:tRNA (cytidine/uridine-2'-O-)-methyltransferase
MPASPAPLRLALFEPDIAANTGTLLRLGACLGVGVDVIEPCGFVWSEPKLRRAGMDYLDRVDLVRHASWARFAQSAAAAQRRLVLLSTRAAAPLPGFAFRAGDTLLLGRESAGVPDAVRDACPASVRIPMREGERSLNVALAAALVLGEALRQLDAYPKDPP